MKIYKFRSCYLNTLEREVIKDGKHLELTPKTFDVLELLLERSGETVSKDEMLGKVWNGSLVEEGNLPVQVSKLRSSLGETTSERFIETVQGRGYRFVAPVEIVPPEIWESQIFPANVSTPPDRSFNSDGLRSIAVLPLQDGNNTSEYQYLADEFTESLINRLSRFPDLKVLARDTVFRYKKKDLSARQIGEILGVTAVLTGRIRCLGDQIAISIELIRVRDGSQIWGNRFSKPFSRFIEMNDDIAAELSQNLRSEHRHPVNDPLTRSQTTDSESYRLYLKGKFFLKKRSGSDVSKALEFFEQSVAKDPTHVLAYVEMVECYLLLYISDSISREKALARIRPILSVVQEMNRPSDAASAMYGGLCMYFYWDFHEAANHLEQALRFNSYSVFALFRYINLLVLTGRHSEALKQLQRIIGIDPLSVSTYKRTGRLFYKMRRYENSIRYLTEALELEPDDYEALLLLGASLAETGMYDDAIAAFERSLALHRTTEGLSMIGYVYAKKGDTEKAHHTISQIEESPKGVFSNAVKLARIYFALGDDTKAFDFLERAFDEHDFDVAWLAVDPRWRSISQNERFKAFVSRLGLPDNGKDLTLAGSHEMATVRD